MRDAVSQSSAAAYRKIRRVPSRTIRTVDITRTKNSGNAATEPCDISKTNDFTGTEECTVFKRLMRFF